MRSLTTILSLLILVSTISGCATIDSNLMMDRNTVVEIQNVTTRWRVSKDVANADNEVRMMVQTIMDNTIDELSKRGITAYTTPTANSAKVKFDVKSIKSGYRVIGSAYSVVGQDRFEIKYSATLESPEGKQLWVYKDEENDSDLDYAFGHIANRVAKGVSKYFADGIIKTDSN